MTTMYRVHLIHTAGLPAALTSVLDLNGGLRTDDVDWTQPGVVQFDVTTSTERFSMQVPVNNVAAVTGPVRRRTGKEIVQDALRQVPEDLPDIERIARASEIAAKQFQPVTPEMRERILREIADREQ
ncbi:hypothetical protein AAFP35_25745 [Gordonia sp. CPCC 206044]|uniref:hypothetical protein n=1 Tax=Gordonia sp. CPCC 206044 TaxID=3140793 RepID=UPI003AF3E9E2